MAMNLTYCSNIHPVRTLDDVLAFLERETRQVADGLGGAEFPLGLWLPAAALAEALEKPGLEKLQDSFRRNRYRAATFNGFPMGVFHGEAVKERVYQPDWSRPERLHYTQDLARLAGRLGLRDIVISTLSGGFRPDDTPERRQQMYHHFGLWIDFARTQERDLGLRARLALEPEPFNTLQDADDAIRFWEGLDSYLGRQGHDRRDMNRHIGICLDTCHMSVRFHDPLAEYRELLAAGIPVFKIQLSAAPRWTPAGPLPLDEFFALAEPVYLHQTYGLDGHGDVHAFADLPQARVSGLDCREWRTHFHVPLHLGEHPNTTGAELARFLREIRLGRENPVLEVETYSLACLRETGELARTGSTADSILRELQWVAARLP